MKHTPDRKAVKVLAIYVNLTESLQSKQSSFNGTVDKSDIRDPISYTSVNEKPVKNSLLYLSIPSP